MVQVVAFTSTLADTTEDRVTTVGLGDVVDELLNEHSLSDTSTSEEADLSTSGVGGEQVNDLDTGFENLSGRRLLDESWGLGMDTVVVVRRC